MNGYKSEIPIAALTLDPLMQGRAAMDNEQIEAYAEAMRDGAQFPPISVVHVAESDTYYVTDGWHRLKAAIAAGRDKIPAIVTAGSYHDAFTAALTANKTHGLPRRNSDKVRVVQLALTDPELSKMTDRGLAEMLGVSQPFVSKFRKQLKVGDNGYQAEPFEKLKINMHDLQPIVRMWCFGGSYWIANKDAALLLRAGLIVYSGSNSYSITMRGREYLDWLLLNTTDPLLKFELELADYAARTNDYKYSWGEGWKELWKLQRAERWQSYYSLGALNTLINRGFALMESVGSQFWVCISPAGSAAIGQPTLNIPPLDKKPTAKYTPPPPTRAEVEYAAHELYKNNLKWSTDRARDHAKELITGYWSKQYFEFYPELKPLFEAARRELLAAMEAATPIPFTPPVVDEPEAEPEAEAV